MGGKHTSEAVTIRQLEETITLKDKEIKDIKNSLADTLQLIRDLNESNNYGDPTQRKRRISEICTDTIYELRIDEIDDFYRKEKAKIIELPTTRQSNK